MFSKIKAIKDLRDQAKKIEKLLTDIIVEGASQGLTIQLNGKQEVLAVHVPETLSHAQLGSAIQKALQDALQKLQGKVQQAIKDAGGLPDMSQLMGQ